MGKRDFPRESARRILWGDRENLLPHLLEHQGCGVGEVAEQLCETAGWTYESYLVAVIFDSDELLVEVTK